MYPKLTGDNLPDFLARKEFISLKSTDDSFRKTSQYDQYTGKYLRPQTYQSFVRNFMNPDTGVLRLGLFHSPGVGKTLPAVEIAQSYAEVYKELYANKLTGRDRQSAAIADRETPSIFVLGFAGTKAAFMRELLRYPEFGFISAQEKEELGKRYVAASSGRPDDDKHYREFWSNLKRRVTNKGRGGFYKFYGYDEFVNKLFTGVDLLDIVHDYRERGQKGNSDIPLSNVFAEYIADGRLRVTNFMSQFNNSIIIADEFHNTYNMDSMNNRGLAIAYLCDNVPTVSLLAMTASPTNNSPMECVDFVNYFLGRDEKIRKSDIFLRSRVLKPGALARLGKLTRGKISFMQDLDDKYFPRRTIMGTEIILRADAGEFKAGDTLPYLKFIECPMSSAHEDALNNWLATGVCLHDDVPAEIDEDDRDHSIPLDGYMIFDMVVPNPDGPFALFQSRDMMKISGASNEWKQQVGIDVRRDSYGGIYTGSFLARENLAEWSTKYATMLDIIMSTIVAAAGNVDKCKKIMIFHNFVRNSGVLEIQEILRVNGFLDTTGDPIASSICCCCGKTYEGHDGDDNRHNHHHHFRPTRVIMAHSGIDKSTLDNDINVKYNSIDNCRGLNFMILLGSKIIKESYDLKDVRILIDLSMPTNVPTQLQVFGRTHRKFAHINLPMSDHTIDIYILVSTYKDGAISPEIRRYAEKLSDYRVIQLIEQQYIENAIDSGMHLGITQSKSFMDQYFPGGIGPAKILGNLYFVPQVVPGPIKTRATFDAFYGDKEVDTILFVLKRLFMDIPARTYDELWAATRAPPFGLETNPAMFDEGNFAIALTSLMEMPTVLTVDIIGEHETAARSLFDPSAKYVYVRGLRHKVVKIGDYYVIFPLENVPTSIISATYSEYAENIRDKERLMIQKYRPGDSKLVVDYNAFLQYGPVRKYTMTPLVSFKTARADKSAEKLNTFGVSTALLWRLGKNEQMTIIEKAIERLIGATATDQDKALIDLYNSLGVIVSASEVSKYADVVSKYTHFPSGDVAAGYTAARAVRLYDAGGNWFEISKVAINRQVNYKENTIIIGYFEFLDEVKFKLRRPKEYVGTSARPRRDIRTIEQGIVCTTKSKADLENIAAQVGIPAIKREADSGKVRNLCELIRDELVQLEIRERGKDTRTRWLYSWWDNAQDIGG